MIQSNKENLPNVRRNGENADLSPEIVDTVLSARIVVRVVLLILAVLFCVTLSGALIYWLSNLILLIVLAILFAYLIAPLVNLVHRPFELFGRPKMIPRPLAIGVVYFAIFATLYGIGAYLLPVVGEQASQFTQQIPEYNKTVRARLEELNTRYENTPMPAAVRERIKTGIEKLGDEIGETAPTVVQTIALSLFTLLPVLILIPILGFFFLKDAELFKLAAVRAFPKGQMRGRAELFLQDLNKTLAAYTRAQLISCALIGTICTTGFYLFGVKYALLLGIIATILEFIPLVGPLIVGILATTIASFYSFRQAVAVAIFLLILRLIHDYITYPRIIREGIHLHPLAIILAVLAGGEIAGVMGIFLSIPVVAVTTVVYRHMMQHSGSAGIVAELLDEGKNEKAIDVAEKELAEIHREAIKSENVRLKDKN